MCLRVYMQCGTLNRVILPPGGEKGEERIREEAKEARGESVALKQPLGTPVDFIWSFLHLAFRWTRWNSYHVAAGVHWE